MRSPFSFLSSLVFLFRWRKKKTGNSTLNGPPITKIRFNTDQFKLRLLLETRVLNFIFITSLDEIGQFFIPSLLLFRTQIALKAEGDRQRRREKREEERRRETRRDARERHVSTAPRPFSRPYESLPSSSTSRHTQFNERTKWVTSVSRRATTGTGCFGETKTKTRNETLSRQHKQAKRQV